MIEGWVNWNGELLSITPSNDFVDDNDDGDDGDDGGTFAIDVERTGLNDKDDGSNGVEFDIWRENITRNSVDNDRDPSMVVHTSSP